jgi:hypothetical protein
MLLMPQRGVVVRAAHREHLPCGSATYLEKTVALSPARQTARSMDTVFAAIDTGTLCLVGHARK